MEWIHLIPSLLIKNFKSIKSLNLDCKKVNIFIGEPNTGKSNILETFGLLSVLVYQNLKKFVRMEWVENLFYDENIEENIIIKFNDFSFEMRNEDSIFRGIYLSYNEEKSKLLGNFWVDNSGMIKKPVRHSNKIDLIKKIKFYRFIKLMDFPGHNLDYLTPPAGENLFNILRTRKEIKKEISLIFKKFGLKLMFKPQDKRLELVKVVDEDILISYPYFLISDTLQRTVFYLVAILSNKDSIIAFEEPESQSFPYYTKYLAEKIALDTNNNQFFISTHNPYFLLSILEKIPSNQINIYLTYLKNYQTKVKLFSQEELKEILDLGIDIFFNVESFLENIQ